YTLSLHDALPIYGQLSRPAGADARPARDGRNQRPRGTAARLSPPGDAGAGRRDLCRALRRRGWADSGDLRGAVPDRLGAPPGRREAALGAAPGDPSAARDVSGDGAPGAALPRPDVGVAAGAFAAV